MCNAIIETNFSQEIDLDSDLLQRISAITGLYWSEDDVDSNDLSDWHERCGSSLAILVCTLVR